MLTWWGAVRRRAASAPAVPATLAAVVALVAVLMAAVLGGAGSVVAAGLQEAIARAPGADRALVISVRRDPQDPSAQEAAVRSALDRTFRGVDVTVDRTDRGEPLPVLPAGAPPEGPAQQPAATRLVPWAGAGIPEHAVLTGGRWPAAPRPGAALEAALQADAAAGLGVRAGDLLRLGRADAAAEPAGQVRVVGLWRVRDAVAPYWAQGALPLTGTARQGVLGPLVVDPAALATLPVRWTTSWTAVPDAATVAPGELEGLVGRLAALPRALDEVPTAGGSPASVGEEGLPALLEAQVDPQRRAAASLAALLALLVTVAAALCLVAASLLAELRAGEWGVLRVRGAGAGQRAAVAAREGLAAAVPAAVPAVGVAALAAALPGAGAATVLGAAGTAVAVTLAAGVVVGVLTEVVQVRRGRAGATRPGSGTVGGSGAQSPAALLALAAGAGLAGWQLSRLDAVGGGGGGASGGGGTGERLDPVPLVAVPVLLVGAAVLAVALLAALARPAGRMTRGQGLVGPLAAWHVARRATRPVTPVVVLVLGTAAAVCTFTAARSVATAATARAALAAPADLVVVVPADPGTPATGGLDASRLAGERLAGLPGATAVSPVVVVDGQAGGLPVRLMALDAAVLPALTAPAGEGAVDAAQAAGLVAAGGDPATVPALVPRAFAETVGLAVGSRLTLDDPTGRRLPLVVSAVVPTTVNDPTRVGERPGAGPPRPALLVDRARMQAVVGALGGSGERVPRQWWLAGTPDPDAVLAAARPAVQPGGSPPRLVSRERVTADLLADPLGTGLQRLLAGSGVALTAAALAALLLGQVVSARRRRVETAALRALGLSVAQLRRLLAVEVLGVAGAAALGGAALGLIAAPLVVPALSGQPPASPIAAGVLPAAAVAAAVLVVAGVAGGVAGRRAGRTDVPGVLREEVR